MTVKMLPDLTPVQVVRLHDALLENADRLLTSARAVLDTGHPALARAIAILGLEESGEAIAVHERRVAMGHLPDGTQFRCAELDELWASHEKKLQTVHRFLVEEPYWFDTQAPDPEDNAAQLGTIRAWARRQDRFKQRGFYVDLAKNGDVMSPRDVPDPEALREVIARVHQIGWQLRLGEHIEGKRQDETEAGAPPMSAEDLAWLREAEQPADANVGQALAELRETLTQGIAPQALPNAAYRFHRPGDGQDPFRNLGKVGYEAQTRELRRLAQDPSETKPQ